MTIFGVGLLYGNGEHILYPFFRALWENKVDVFPESKAHICALHVKNLGVAIRQLLLSSSTAEADPDNKEPPKRYAILCESTCHTFNTISQQITKFLAKSKKPIDISQYPQNLPQIPQLFPLQTVVLTTELAAECTQMIEDFTPDPEDIINAAAKIVDKFRQKCSIEPLKVLVVGPPGSGYVTIATEIANDLNIPLIDPEVLCKEVQTDNSQWAQDIMTEIQEAQEENENEKENESEEVSKKIIPIEKIPNEVVSKIVHHRMNFPDCHNLS